MAELPFMLAGPILRRVEPRLVAVWVALREPRSVLLTIFDGRQQAGTGADIFTGGTPVAAGAATTLRAGAKLHVGVIVAELKEPAQPLQPGRNYSYNVGFGPFEGEPGSGTDDGVVRPDVAVSADLRSLGLLETKVLNGFPHLALGYADGELPGFALPPAALTDLRMLHGSCRRPAFTYGERPGKDSYDGLAWVDDLILSWRRGSAAAAAFDANVRPHQLFLTGDQIYADDVDVAMLPMLNTAGNELVGRDEPLPTVYPPKPDEASKERYLGAPVPAGFASIAEFVAKKKQAGEDPLKALKGDRRVRALADPCFDRRFRLLYDRAYAVDPPLAGEALHTWPSDLRHFPAGLRRPVMECETKFSSADLAQHLMSFGEYCAMYLAVWSNGVWPVTNGRPSLPALAQTFPLPDGDLPQIWELHACFGDTIVERTNRQGLDTQLTKLRVRDPAGYEKRVATLEAFFDSLARVRRALANVPTYMIFDDHDVTDDWNIVRAWRDQVHTTALGRRILTTSMVAYALFQDWGNDPLRYRTGDARRLLELAVKLFPAEPSPAVPEAVAKDLATLLGLDQPDPEQPAPRLKWHFTIDGPRHRVVGLDTRTRRRYRSRHLPSGLLSAKALDEQLPDPEQAPLPSGVEVLVAISQTPVAMPSVASSVVVPLMGSIEEFGTRNRWRNLPGLEPDNEIWPGDDGAWDAVLRRLAGYKRVVVLSGEVHWGSTARISYWRRGPRRLSLAAALRTDLDGEPDGHPVTPPLASAFAAAGFPLSAAACAVPRPGNEEWLVVDPPPARRMFLVRAEADGIHVYEEEEPAQIAQFVSSGLKNVKAMIAGLARMLGFAFTLLDTTPAERLGWLDSTPPPLQPPAGGRFPPAVRDRLAREPVTVPSGHWPPGTVMTAPPDFGWRLDMVRDERPEGERAEFTRVDPLPTADTTDSRALEDAAARIAARHADHLQSGKLRFGRGPIYQSNLGLVRFERDGTDIVACHDVYSHPPGRDEATLTVAHRVSLQAFGDRRPRLRFDVAVET